jgi:hypothetical protein
VQVPDRINSQWLDALSDDELRGAEGELHAQFTAADRTERKLRGTTYDLMRGPETLTRAWMRWSMVSSAARARGLRVWERR